ncbi:tRNA pseudouridine(38-40) synthase TruA [Methanoculleus sp. FWC-SCC1]|uniref:tRNA pseudouridine synthase A n=1 Tax=Methanoculleus frigidifontis TaxID=2584085 RepID=A0ABT8MDQ5_9EURY|nr:tRNA pseudouridine(38-40) synthase TruA [Methanoculleus sp. FWC-SCC1]MDN7026078.1 tRNA pseudouridine(38-40) synthase TruA [Methanoculleus sp. FWC-SCC1]
MTRLAFRLVYLGGDFYGSQMQPELRTVEGEVIESCRRLGLFDDWRDAGFRIAGRTDRGVHACGQVCAFTTDREERAVQALNPVLPPDIWCTAWASVPDSFHPRYDALSRTYRYYFPDPPDDVSAMQEMARRFIGSHNFSSFARVGDKNPVRTVLAADIRREGRFCVFEVTAKSFLWNMVRCMATALLLAGRGAADIDELAGLLEEPTAERFPASPPDGLILWDVAYDVTFLPLCVDEKHQNHLRMLYRRYSLMEEITCVLSKETSER